MDGERIIYGSDFTYGKEVKHIINAGYHTKLNGLTPREIQYLNCHNWRRKKYHEEYGATYVPLRYDLRLQADAQYWANQLLKECHLNGIRVSLIYDFLTFNTTLIMIQSHQVISARAWPGSRREHGQKCRNT